MKIIAFISLLFLTSTASISQNTKSLDNFTHIIDSLQKCIHFAKTDTDKANIFFSIGTYWQSINQDSALSNLNKALRLYVENHSKDIFPSWENVVSPSSLLSPDKRINYANTLCSISWVFGNNLGKNDTAIFLAFKALTVLNSIITKDTKSSIQLKNNFAICYNTLASEYNNIGEYDKAMEFYRKALKILEDIGINKSGICNCYMNIGIVYDEQGQYAKAIEYYNKALEINKNPENKTNSSNCYSNLGIVYWELADYNKAIEYYLKALKINEELGKTQNIGFTLNNIGLVYREKGDYVTAIDYFQKALKIKETLNNQNDIADSYCNIGLVHLDQDSYDNALNYFQKAQQIYLKTGEKDGIANCYNNIATIYNDLKQWDKAIDYLNKSIKIREELKDINGLAANYSNLGTNHLSQGNLPLAKIFFQKAIDMYQELGAKNELSTLYNNFAELQFTLKDFKKSIEFAQKGLLLAKETGTLPNENLSYKILKNAFYAIGQHKQALENAELYITTRDSLFKQEKIKAITEMESKYQSEKKQLEIEKLGKEKELQISEVKKQKLIILFVTCGLLLVLGFSIILFRLFLQKKKTNKIITEKNAALQIAYEEINTQKEEIIVQRDSIQAQKEIIEEHQKEIEDSINYAKRIQHAVMPDLEFGSWNLALESFILFKPKDIVSGDFYWATKINDWLIITVADCTGHGVPGAFMSMLGISFLNEIVRKKEITKASEVLQLLRLSVIDALKQRGESGEQKDGMDIALCVLNLNTLEMQYAGANNPCWIASRQSSVNSPLIELKPDKQPIGIHTNMLPFKNQTFQLQKGEIIYLMSDGFEDQFGGPNRKKFLSKNLKNLLTENCHNSMPDQKINLENTITDWIGNNEQIDDITLLGIKIH